MKKRSQVRGERKQEKNIYDETGYCSNYYSTALTPLEMYCKWLRLFCDNIVLKPVPKLFDENQLQNIK